MAKLLLTAFRVSTTVAPCFSTCAKEIPALLSLHRYTAIQYAVVLSIRRDKNPLLSAHGAATADATSISANSTDKDPLQTASQKHLLSANS